ncbi:LPXTG cell wall anchor domain-containing protein [Kitasatospora sp. NPDC049285]|uniref:LPXTG cell wall anchor domain-containing protein n=1 Tax=Kitasatospora sp. NPDC049285 TaxID=3157096 RepID=UPI00343F3DC1
MPARHRPAALAALLLAGLLATGTATTAVAADAPAPTLAVQAPAALAFAGGPLPLVETVTNPGPTARQLALRLAAETGPGASKYDLAIGYRDPADGQWKSVPLTFADGVFTGSQTITAAPGTTTVQLRIGAPMGLPHHGASNGGFQHVALKSTLTEPGATQPLAEQRNDLGMVSIDSELQNVPASAVVGGAPVEFDWKISNGTPAEYTNVNDVLWVDPHATVQKQVPGQGWVTLKAEHVADADYVAVRVDEPDLTFAAHTDRIPHLRVSYAADTPVGSTKLNACLIVDESHENPFNGTTMCQAGRSLTLTAATTATPTPAPTPTPTATATAGTGGSTGSTDGSSGDSSDGSSDGSSDRLAETGSSGTGLVAGLGGLLVAAGGAVLWLLARRRRHTA